MTGIEIKQIREGMKITLKELEDKGACDLDRFQRLFGEKVEITEENCLLAIKAELNLEWIAENFFTVSAQKAYKEASISSCRIYVKTVVSAWETYRKARATALEAYEKASATALEAYEKARAPALEAYKKTRAIAFYHASLL